MGGVSVSRVVRGGFWLYLSMIINNVAGFIYWLLISRIAGSTILGLTSATIGLATLVNGLASFGIGIGLQHFLGQCIGRRDPLCFKKYFWSTLLFSASIYLAIGGGLIALGLTKHSFFNFTPTMLFYAGILVMLGFNITVYSSIVAQLSTHIIALSAIIGNALKIFLGIMLVKCGLGFGGAVLGYTMISLTILLLGLYLNIKNYGIQLFIDKNILKNVLRGSIVSWIPGVVVLAGQWIGVLTVYGSSGALETGHYYVAYVIANFILGISISMLSLLLPVLSGLSDGRKRAAFNVFKISLLFVFPVAVYVAVYPWLPLGLLGKEYIGSSNILTVLLVSVLALPFYAVINSLLYSYKDYSRVLFLGLSQNIPRIAAYLILVPGYGGLGAAYSFTLGSYTGFVYSLYLAKKINYEVDWILLVKIIVPPSIIGALSYMLHLHWLIGLILTAVVYLVYGKIGVLRKQDLKTISYAFLGEKTAQEIYKRLGFLIDLFFS